MKKKSLLTIISIPLLSISIAEDIHKIDLGTLRDDNSGNSYATGVSADGKVVVGYADTNSGYYQAFKHIEGQMKMIGLGALRDDNSGISYARAVSADGKVVVGYANTNSGSTQAFKHIEGQNKMIGLGTLRDDNLGYSYAWGVSADGKVVVGDATTNSGSAQAFKHIEGQNKMIGLGTLKDNNSGYSRANGVSADGKIVVGNAATNSGDQQAFKHIEGQNKMIGLGTLEDDNSGYSYALGVSADGKIVVGYADTNSGELHAAVWKTISPDPIDPVNPPTIVIVDATNSNKTMIDSAQKTYQVLDLYRSRLMSLSDAECFIGDKNYCVGVFTNFDGVKSNHTFATGIFSAVRFNAQWSAGLSIDYLADSSLPSGFKTRGSSNPGIGGFINFQQNSDQSGFNVKLSGAFQEEKLSITRQQLSKTEAGIGDTKVKSNLLKLGTDYGIRLSEQSMIFPHVGILYTEVSRDAYTENRNAHFPASFGKASDKRTSVELGIKAAHAVSNAITVAADAGAYINLDHKRDNFTGNIDYIGAHVYDFGDDKKVQPYVSLGIQGEISNNSVINLKTRWSKQTYNNDSFNIGLSYSYRF